MDGQPQLVASKQKDFQDSRSSPIHLWRRFPQHHRASHWNQSGVRAQGWVQRVSDEFRLNFVQNNNVWHFLVTSLSSGRTAAWSQSFTSSTRPVRSATTKTPWRRDTWQLRSDPSHKSFSTPARAKLYPHTPRNQRNSAVFFETKNLSSLSRGFRVDVQLKCRLQSLLLDVVSELHKLAFKNFIRIDSFLD